MRFAIDPRYTGALMDSIVASADDVMKDRGRVLKHDRTTTVVQVEADSMTWVIKRYNTKNLWHAIRRTLRHSRAFNCWEMSAEFIAADIPVPVPVGFIERKIGPFRGRSYFLYEYVDAQDLLSFMKKHAGLDEFEMVLQKIKDMFHTLRQSGLNHGDMKATNILVEPDFGLRVLDLDAARKAESTNAFERGYARDRSRFLRNWQHDPGLLDRIDSVLPA